MDLNRYLIGALAGLVVFVGVVWQAYNKGFNDAETALVKGYTQAYLSQYEHYRAAESDLNQQLDAIDSDHFKELMDAQVIIDDVLDAVGTGERKLYVKANCAKVPAAREDSEPARVGDAAGRAELDRNTAQRLIRLTERGDNAIRQLGACQAFINTIIESQSKIIN